MASSIRQRTHSSSNNPSALQSWMGNLGYYPYDSHQIKYCPLGRAHIFSGSNKNGQEFRVGIWDLSEREDRDKFEWRIRVMQRLFNSHNRFYTISHWIRNENIGYFLFGCRSGMRLLSFNTVLDWTSLQIMSFYAELANIFLVLEESQAAVIQLEPESIFLEGGNPAAPVIVSLTAIARFGDTVQLKKIRRLSTTLPSIIKKRDRSPSPNRLLVVNAQMNLESFIELAINLEGKATPTSAMTTQPRWIRSSHYSDFKKILREAEMSEKPFQSLKINLENLLDRIEKEDSKKTGSLVF